MHYLFLHQNFPAQFGNIALRLVQNLNNRCTFVTKRQVANGNGVEIITYQPQGGATERNHYSSRSFENMVWQSHAVYETLRQRPEIQPDIIVGHAGFVSTVLLRELYNCPMVNYFEYYYHNKGTDLDFRPEMPPREQDCLRTYFRNACLLMDLENSDLGYSPTIWQRNQLPLLYHSKVRVIFDGVDTQVWYPRPRSPRQAGRFVIPEDVKLVTYVARGLESIRGFDMFMKVAKKLCDLRSDVRFLIIGEDKAFYGDDASRTGVESFKNWVLSQDTYDLSRFVFVPRVPPDILAQVFSITDLHIYFTVPFVLSWSLMDALACGTTVLASSTPPVKEMIIPEKNGLLADFFDIDGFVEQANRVLDDPQKYRPLGEAGRQMILKKYSLDVCLPQMQTLYEDAIKAYRKVTDIRGTK